MCCELLLIWKCHILWPTHPPSQMTPTPQTDANAQHFYPGVYSSQISTESCFLFVVLTYFSPEVIFGPSWILKTNPKWLQEFCKFSKNSPRRQTKHQKLSSFWPILLKTELHSLQNPLNRCHWLVWTSTAPYSNDSECVCKLKQCFADNLTFCKASFSYNYSVCMSGEMSFKWKPLQFPRSFQEIDLYL